MESSGKVDKAHDLATRIYVELVARNVEVTQESVKLSTSAANLATISLRLAEAFLQAEAAAEIAKEPTKKHTLEGADIASWSK